MLALSQAGWLLNQTPLPSIWACCHRMYKVEIKGVRFRNRRRPQGSCMRPPNSPRERCAHAHCTQPASPCIPDTAMPDGASVGHPAPPPAPRRRRTPCAPRRHPSWGPRCTVGHRRSAASMCHTPSLSCHQTLTSLLVTRRDSAARARGSGALCLCSPLTTHRSRLGWRRPGSALLVAVPRHPALQS